MISEHSMVQIRCTSYSRFNFSQSRCIYITNLKLIGRGGNQEKVVEKFVKSCIALLAAIPWGSGGPNCPYVRMYIQLAVFYFQYDIVYALCEYYVAVFPLNFCHKLVVKHKFVINKTDASKLVHTTTKL